MVTQKTSQRNTEVENGTPENETDTCLASAFSDLHRTLSHARPELEKRQYDLPEFDGRPEEWHSRVTQGDSRNVG